MKILITGAAGFIGFITAHGLISSGHEVLGIDNINSYYDINLKLDRLGELGIPKISIVNNEVISSILILNLQK